MSDYYDNDEIEKEESAQDQEKDSQDTKDAAGGKEADGQTSVDADGVRKESEYEDVCFICRRPESKTGKMFKLPNHISVCNDCMHKTMDTVSQIGRASCRERV